MLKRLPFFFDSKLTVANVLDKSLKVHGPATVALQFDPDDIRYLVSHGTSLTLGELSRLVNRLSNVLVSLGIKRFDRVMICKKQSVDYLIYSLAIYRAGGITVPVNGGMSANDLNHYVQLTSPRFWFADPTTLTKLDASIAGEIQIVLDRPVADAGIASRKGVWFIGDLLHSAPDYFKAVEIHPTDDVMIVHTSGTTGFPKGVLHGSRSVIQATRGQLLIQPFGSKDSLLLATPANHHITQAGIVTGLCFGGKLYVPGKLDASTLLDTLEREKLPLMVAFPDIYQEFCEWDLGLRDLSHVKAWMAGGDCSHEVHIRRLTAVGSALRLFGKPILSSAYLEFLGTSEVGFAALVKVSFAKTRRFQRCVGKRSPLSPKVRLVDEQGRTVATGKPGRLMVKGPTLFKGYWNDHAKLHHVYCDGWWWTGDIAFRHSSGNYYHLDRQVDSITGNGKTYYTLPIEEELLKHPSVREVAVVPLDDAKTPIGAVIEQYPQHATTTSDLQAWAQEHLPDGNAIRLLALPAYERLPRGLTGKVLKRKVREQFSGHPTA